MHILGTTMASHFFGRGGSRQGGCGRGHKGGRELHIVDDCPPLPHPRGIHFTYGVINFSNGDQHQGSVPNIVIFFHSIKWTFISRIIIFIS
jgi:hypothetical protein